MKKGVILCVLFVLFTMCKKQTEKEDMNKFPLLYGKIYILKIDKISNHPKVQFPRDPLQNSDYTPTTQEIQYNIAFSENGEKITIEPGPVRGIKINNGEDSIHYKLNEGLFAGGRLSIWSNNNDFEVEYTVYGSGVPIIKSERGTIESATK
jgi:hypothetical protein